MELELKKPFVRKSKDSADANQGSPLRALLFIGAALLSANTLCAKKPQPLPVAQIHAIEDKMVEWDRLSQSGKSIEADKANKDATNLFVTTFPVGSVFVATSDCPLQTNYKAGIFIFGCTTVPNGVRITIQTDPRKSEGTKKIQEVLENGSEGSKYSGTFEVVYANGPTSLGVVMISLDPVK